MASLFSLQPLVRIFVGTMNSVLDTWRKSFVRLAYLPVLEPCSTTYSKLRVADGDRVGPWSVDGEHAGQSSHPVTPITFPNSTAIDPVEQLPVAQRLPYEILVAIFLDVEEVTRKEWGGPFFGDQRHAHPAFCCVTLSHVCYRWRSVMLDQSAFWARNVTSFSRAPREELVERARGIPMDALLHVWRHQRPFEDPDFRFLRDHICDLRSLALWLPENALPALGLVLPAIETSALDLLESLEMTLYDAHPGVRMQEFRALPPLHTPSLRKAVFRDCFLFLEAPGQVTHLEIIFRRCYRANTDGALLTPSELSNILASCTNLDHLRLGDELPLFGPESSPIALPRLQKLALEGSSTRCGRLLEVLTYPKDATVHVRGHNIPSPISHEAPAARDSILRAVEAVHTRGYSAKTTARVFPGMSFELIRERSRLRGEGVHLAFEHFEHGPPIREVLQMFALARVAVHSIRTDHDADLNELCVLLTPIEHGADGVEVPFPELETLHLSGKSSRFIVSCAASLLATQKRRTQFSRPLKRLVLSYPSSDWSTMQDTPLIQVLQRILPIDYKDINTNPTSVS
ncbi:hypothetical protein PENSPDRAFT_388217 [Peniophora sp. CONT]|nr:hypothetical protein PENSPDRAFT_388217 [Peniophora sp. CONT]